MPRSSCRRSRVETSLGFDAVLPEMLARYSGRLAGVCAGAEPTARPVARTPAVSPNKVLLILPPFLAKWPFQVVTVVTQVSEKYGEPHRGRQGAGQGRRQSRRRDVRHCRLQEDRCAHVGLIVGLEHQLARPLEDVL